MIKASEKFPKRGIRKLAEQFECENSDKYLLSKQVQNTLNQMPLVRCVKPENESGTPSLVV